MFYCNQNRATFNNNVFAWLVTKELVGILVVCNIIQLMSQDKTRLHELQDAGEAFLCVKTKNIGYSNLIGKGFSLVHTVC
jgi:hypothetical protein